MPCMSRLLVAVLAAAVVAAGIRWGTFAVGGSDSYCYVHQAELWAAGSLRPVEPLALEAPWPDAALTFSPAGHVPSLTVRGAAAPICPPGLAIVMAPFLALGGIRALFVVVPLFGALLIAATYVVGARFGPRVGVASALLTACSPALLFQVVQPMSDVPAAALWVLAVAWATSSRRSGPAASGIATSAALLMRPNLLPMGVTIGLFFLVRGDRAWRDRVRDAAMYAAGSASGCIAVAAIQQWLYGSPFRSGYGSLDGLFAFGHVAPNALRYLRWLSESHTPAWLLALAAPVLLRGRLANLLLGLFAVNLACYLGYTVFDDWWYLRFLLPTIPLIVVLTVAVADAIARRLTLSIGGLLKRRVVANALVAVLTAALATVLLEEARARRVFDLHRLEARYVAAGRFVADRLPANALVITSWESGSVRFYSGRPTLVWDSLDPAWLDRALAFARSRGLEPFLLFERWEEPIFRRRFAGSDLAALDWPPMAEIVGQVQVYRPDDRARYSAGAGVATEYVR